VIDESAPRDTPERQAVVAHVAERVLRLERAGHPVRVGVDGRSAAGKTTFANALARRLRARTGRELVRAELDHFMRMVADRDAYPYDSPESFYLDSFDHAAIRGSLLEPLGPGGDRWFRDASEAGRRTVGKDAILVADGVFLQRPELDPYWELRIYLEVGSAESLRRGVERDRHWLGSARVAEDRFRSTYLPAELRYLAEVGPLERAQIVIGNDDPGRPVISRG
jgi:uridine kinase